MESKNLDAALAAKNTATDGAYIMAQDASGNTIRIAKADLASVLAEAMLGSLGDLDILPTTTHNFSTTNNSTLNVPDDVAYGLCITFKVNVSQYMQFLLSTRTAALYTRVYWNEWKSWVKITGTSLE